MIVVVLLVILSLSTLPFGFSCTLFDVLFISLCINISFPVNELFKHLKVSFAMLRCIHSNVYPSIEPNLCQDIDRLTSCSAHVYVTCYILLHEQNLVGLIIWNVNGFRLDGGP